MQHYPISLQRLESRHTAKKLLQMIHTYRTTIDMGIHVAGHSDSTVSAADPLLGIQDKVTRKGQMA